MRIILWALVLVSSIASAAQTASSQRSKGPIVFINGNGRITSESKDGSKDLVITPPDFKHDQTMQMAQELMKRCPEASLTLESVEAHPDYEILLHRQPAGIGGNSQFVVVRTSDQIIIFANQKGTVSRAMRASCSAILADWHERRGITAQTTNSADKKAQLSSSPGTPSSIPLPELNKDWWNRKSSGGSSTEEKH